MIHTLTGTFLSLAQIKGLTPDEPRLETTSATFTLMLAGVLYVLIILVAFKSSKRNIHSPS